MDTLKIRANNLLICTEDFIKECESLGVTNEQWFIDFEDKLNELSIKDHNK